MNANLTTISPPWSRESNNLSKLIPLTVLILVLTSDSFLSLFQRYTISAFVRLTARFPRNDITHGMFQGLAFCHHIYASTFNIISELLLVASHVV